MYRSAALALFAALSSCTGEKIAAGSDPCAALCAALGEIDCPELSCADCLGRNRLAGAARCGVELEAYYACALGACERDYRRDYESRCSDELGAFNECRMAPCEPAVCSEDPCACTRSCAQATIEARCETQERTECTCAVDGVVEFRCTVAPTSQCMVRGCCGNYL